jgi:hypothetical protein
MVDVSNAEVAELKKRQSEQSTLSLGDGDEAFADSPFARASMYNHDEENPYNAINEIKYGG